MPFFVMMGLMTGLRTMTPIAVLCWFAWLGLLPQTGWASWTGSLAAVIIFSLAALGEYVGDVLPQTPARIARGPLAARLVFGILATLLTTHAMTQPPLGGILFGFFGALFGAFIGYSLRTRIARWAGRDMPVGIVESVLTLGLTIGSLYWLHLNYLIEIQRATQ